MINQENNSIALNCARKIRQKKLSDNTKEQYDRKFEHFIEWLREFDPQCFDKDGLFIRLRSETETETLETFFGHI